MDGMDRWDCSLVNGTVGRARPRVDFAIIGRAGAILQLWRAVCLYQPDVWYDNRPDTT